MLRDLERAIDRLQTAADALLEMGVPEAENLAAKVKDLRLQAQFLHERLTGGVR